MPKMLIQLGSYQKIIKRVFNYGKYIVFCLQKQITFYLFKKNSFQTNLNFLTNAKDANSTRGCIEM